MDIGNWQRRMVRPSRPSVLLQRRSPTRWFSFVHLTTVSSSVKNILCSVSRLQKTWSWKKHEKTHRVWSCWFFEPAGCLTWRLPFVMNILLAWSRLARVSIQYVLPSNSIAYAIFAGYVSNTLWVWLKNLYISCILTSWCILELHRPSFWWNLSTSELDISSLTGGWRGEWGRRRTRGGPGSKLTPMFLSFKRGPSD